MRMVLRNGCVVLGVVAFLLVVGNTRAWSMNALSDTAMAQIKGGCPVICGTTVDCGELTPICNENGYKCVATTGPLARHGFKKEAGGVYSELLQGCGDSYITQKNPCDHLSGDCGTLASKIKSGQCGNP